MNNKEAFIKRVEDFREKNIKNIANNRTNLDIDNSVIDHKENTEEKEYAKKVFEGTGIIEAFETIRDERMLLYFKGKNQESSLPAIITYSGLSFEGDDMFTLEISASIEMIYDVYCSSKDSYEYSSIKIRRFKSGRYELLSDNKDLKYSGRFYEPEDAIGCLAQLVANISTQDYVYRSEKDILEEKSKRLENRYSFEEVNKNYKNIDKQLLRRGRIAD